MRRSKSNPVKYVSNYRSISQRRMTNNHHPDDDNELEMARLRQVILASATPTKEAKHFQKPSPHLTTSIKARNRTAPGTDKNNDTTNVVDGSTSMLSPELLNDYASDEMVVTKAKKKIETGAKKARTVLTPQEIKQAATASKKATRKLQQLKDRAVQKQKRAQWYDSLQATAISTESSQLLSRAADLGKPVTKRQHMQQLLRKEQAGLTLSNAEQTLLYQPKITTTTTTSRTMVNHNRTDPDDTDDDDGDCTSVQADDNSNNSKTTAVAVEDSTVAAAPTFSPPPRKAKRGLEAERSKSAAFVKLDPKKQKMADSNKERFLEQNCTARKKSTPDDVESVMDRKGSLSVEDPAIFDDTAEISDVQKAAPTLTVTATVKPTAVGVSLASQMMASLTTLKKESSVKAAQTATVLDEAKRDISSEEKKTHKQGGYVPSKPVEIQTTQSYSQVKVVESVAPSTNNRCIRTVQRPQDLDVTRYDLPVAAMEFEVMDAVNNNDVTILCSETGSGKSTQVPQFLYEAGWSHAVVAGDDNHHGVGGLIGVTQPRRVAAVSTAKRVCYEMGQGNGQTIPCPRKKEQGNLVAYQTRYETAGLGNQTHIKFMTDGILLQEIQTDLLLHKYSVIVLDEAHERNLNTDVLIGLLSVALPLRKQAAQQESTGLLPLKIIIMSATLRVEDFTGNNGLFPSTTTLAVVKVPGRTHPVTIHHSKVTELDDYDDAAFKKICKIHRQLPQGGILLFLTGKQEIIRMVNRLRRALNHSLNDRRNDASVRHDRNMPECTNNIGDNMPRDMDDDEIDGDLFESFNGPDDFDSAEINDLDLDDGGTLDIDVAIPQKAVILPLYSLLSVDEQAQVFTPVPEGCRLIVVATNIAETSITIPGVTYVVDSGRQKCRNYNAGTGVASFDIMWISKASADQRAGRAGRTGPGHCYRLYSSSLYSRQMDAFALPEVLTRPLEDVVLLMKAMKISNVCDFPFPTPPDRSQVDAAARLLANIGCVNFSKVEEVGGDGEITRLGSAVAKLPLGVRHGKILLVAAEAGVLDYAIVVVAALSESNPFSVGGQSQIKDSDDDANVMDDNPDNERKDRKSWNWTHKSGDALAAMHAVGGYTFAGRAAGGASEKLACDKFCKENGLHPVIMERIQKTRSHLARLSKTRLGNAEGVAASTGGFLSSMPPPNKLQEHLLCQSIASGLLDNVAMLAPLGSIPGQHPYSLRSAYLSCSLTVKEPLFMDRNSAVYSRDSRLLPQWICFETLTRKTLKDGTSVAIMKNITPIDPSWLGRLAQGSRLLTIGEPLLSPLPVYDPDCDAVMCSMKTKFGSHGWEIPPIKKVMFDALQTTSVKQSPNFMFDDSFRWFGRYLLEGKVFPSMKGLADMLNDSPSIITNRTPVSKVALLVSSLSGAGVDSAAALQKHWAEVDKTFLSRVLKQWVKDERLSDFKSFWITIVKKAVHYKTKKKSFAART